MANAIADERGRPPANDFQGQTEWYSNCLSVTLSLFVPPSSENTSAQVEGINSLELVRSVSTLVDLQNLMSSLASQHNRSSSSELTTGDASQNRTTSSHLGRQPPISDATAEHPSPESQDPEAVVPNSTDSQGHGFSNLFDRLTDIEHQDQSQFSSLENTELVCRICSGTRHDSYCPMYSPDLFDLGDIYEA